MVFVKVRETYDLHTIKNKMSVIGIHTPQSTLVKCNYPGLLLQCKAYRPVSCDVRLACASMQPLDPKGVGIADGDVAPEDVFNPILYKAMSNKSMSQLEAWINSPSFASTPGNSISGQGADVDIASGFADDFNIYYGLLSQTNVWKHANPQQGLAMSGLIPLVYETYQTIGENTINGATELPYVNPEDQVANVIRTQTFRGDAKRLPMLNCTLVHPNVTTPTSPDHAMPGFTGGTVANYQVEVPDPKLFCGCIIIPPSRLHQLFYRMVVEWTLNSL